MMAPPSPAAPQGFAQMFSSLGLILSCLLVGYLFFIRPLSKERREKESMRASLKAGDRVLTIGGVFGTVTRIGDRSVHLRVSDGVQMEFARTAIASIVAQEQKE